MNLFDSSPPWRQYNGYYPQYQKPDICSLSKLFRRYTLSHEAEAACAVLLLSTAPLSLPLYRTIQKNSCQLLFTRICKFLSKIFMLLLFAVFLKRVKTADNRLIGGDLKKKRYFLAADGKKIIEKIFQKAIDKRKKMS